MSIEVIETFYVDTSNGEYAIEKINGHKKYGYYAYPSKDYSQGYEGNVIELVDDDDLKKFQN